MNIKELFGQEAQRLIDQMHREVEEAERSEDPLYLGEYRQKAYGEMTDYLERKAETWAARYGVDKSELLAAI